MTDQRLRSLGPEGNYSPPGASNILQKNRDVSSSGELPDRASTRCPSRLVLLQCPQPLLLPVLSSCTYFFSPRSLPLSPLRFFAFDKSCVVPLTTSLPRLSSLHPSPGLAARGAATQRERAASCPGMAPSFPPSLPRASSLAVKRVEKRKQKLVTPEYAQR